MKNYEKALEYYERALQGFEKMLGKNHPSTLRSVEGMVSVLYCTDDFVEAEILYVRAHEGVEVQLGKDHEDTKRCVKSLKNCLDTTGNSEKLASLTGAYPWLSNPENV